MRYHRDVPARKPPVTQDADQLAAMLQAIARKDATAFSQLYRETSAHLFGLLLRMLRRRDLAEEALQDTYVRVWQKAGSFDATRGQAMAWIASIARHRGLDLLRARRPEVPESVADNPAALAAGEATQGDAAQAVDDDVALQQLHRCLRELSDEQRNAVMLAYYEGYTHPELSERMSAPLGTVKSWVRRGLQRLRECLER